MENSEDGGSNPPASINYKGYLDFLLNSIIFSNLIEVFFMSVSLISLQCDNCKEEFERKESAHRDNLKRGRTTTFCSLSCSCSYSHTQNLLNPEGINYVSNFGDKIGRAKDEYTPFRWFMRGANRRDKEVNIDLKYLKQLWEEQKGLCIFTKWKLTLPDNSDGWKDTKDKIYRASLDRIDSSKGYIKGNVQFVSLMANLAKSNMTDDQMVKFCKAVAECH